MFQTSRPIRFLDYFRIPYAVCPPGAAQGPVSTPSSDLFSWIVTTADPHGPRLLCLAPGLDPTRLSALKTGCFRLGKIPIFGTILGDGAWQRELDHSWQLRQPVTAEEGGHVADVWEREDGSILFPFDPDSVILTFLSEAYRGLGSSPWSGRLSTAARWSYYRIRPLIPRPTQIGLRKALIRAQQGPSFPQWPVEPALHDLYDFLLAALAAVAGGPVPFLRPWPASFTWALVLTHDVESAAGLKQLPSLRSLELEHGYRSAWNFVPRRYPLDDSVVRELQAGGFEVGVHGLYHDGRDLESFATLRRRRTEIHGYAQRWQATGFRAPATQRGWELMRLLDFDYDSSYPDSDPYEAIAGGCCSWLPFENGHLVELPITLPQDFVLFDLLGEPDESAWLDKTNYLRARGGMALLITHPDYMTDEKRFGTYARFLTAYENDATAWRALPSDVHAWWRRRSKSWPVRAAHGWHVIGPAASEAEVGFWPAPTGGAATMTLEAISL